MDEPHLEHGGIERTGALDVVDLLRLAEQLTDLASIVAREVRADSLTKVRRLADIQRPATGVTKQVHAGPAGEPIGESQLRRLRMAVDAGSASKSSRPSTPNAAARSSNRCSKSVVASASSSARCDG